MDSPIEEIRDAISQGDFQNATRLANEWLSSFSLEEQERPEYQSAREAYLYSRYFMHRQERLSTLEKGASRARVFLDFFSELKELRRQNGFSDYESLLWLSLNHYMHLQIAEGFARAFAGQKSYNLDDEEIIQLGVSLLKLERWQSALEALSFLHRLKKHNPVLFFLMAIAHFQLGEKEDFSVYMSDALYAKPELSARYHDLLPEGTIRALYDSLRSENDEEERCRHFALLLEINGVYTTRRKVSEPALAELEKEFELDYKTWQEHPEERSRLLPFLLLRLCRLIPACKSAGNYEKLEDYRNIMVVLSPDTWESFQKSL